ncbi:MAG: GC-type dockerin domain-anchored protein [Phycisphaerales bacterium]|jgi:hypothetical protein
MARLRLAIVGLASCTPASLGQYALHELAPPPGATDTVVTAIDEDGAIVGSARLATGRIAVRWASFDSMPEVLGTLDGGATSEATAISGGLVVGVSDRACGQRGAFLWTAGGGLVSTGPAACVRVSAIDVNAAGWVLLQVGEPASPVAWPLGAGTPRPLDTWGQPASLFRIEDDGAALGSSQFHPEGEGQTRAIEWPATGPGRLLERLDPDATGTDAALDRHDSGLIVGFSRAESTRRATVWDAAGEPTDVGASLGAGVGSRLNRINADGLAVGWSSTGAIAWDSDGGVRRLADMVDESGDGWELLDGQDVNDAGTIVGNGLNPDGRPRGFVLAVGGAACPADLDGDGELTIFDFLEFQNLFDAGDARADLDGDGSLTIFDFLAFQNLFDAGC